MLPTLCLTDTLDEAETVALYAANAWSAAGKPQQLLGALRNSHSLVTARLGERLVGLGNAISDGHLVVYFPHLLVHPDLHGQGIGRKMMEVLLGRYRGLHQLMLIADREAAGFYEALGFVRAGETIPMWIYAGNDH